MYWNFWNGYSPGCHCGGPSSVPYRTIWDLFWRNWNKDRFLFFKYFQKSLSEPFNIKYFIHVLLMLNNAVIEGVVNTTLLSLSLSVSILLIFRLSFSLPQYVMSCLQETQSIFLMCRIYKIMALRTIARGELNKLLNSISTIYNVYLMKLTFLHSAVADSKNISVTAVFD